MRRWITLVLVVVAACGADKVNGDVPDASTDQDAAPSPDAPPGCTTRVEFSPKEPVAGADSKVIATGVVEGQASFLTYAWKVERDGVAVPFDAAAPELKAIQFTVATAGVYVVHFQAGEQFQCTPTDVPLTVKVAGAGTASWRLRVTPPPSTSAPPQMIPLTYSGGADVAYDTIALQSGASVLATVKDTNNAAVPGYLRFTPQNGDPPVEATASVTGMYSARVGNGLHDVLIVPDDDATRAPALIKGWSVGTKLILPAADTITGRVLDASSKGIAGARVAVTIGGVPATIATTNATGDWTALGHVGGLVDVAVVPPDASGLPRLAIAGAVIDAAQPITIQYAAAVTTVDVGGTAIKRAGAAAPGARVTFTGAIASAGTISVPGKSVTASGAVQLVAIAGGTGALASQRVPKAPLVAVIEPTAMTPAVVAVDTTGGAPASIDAPPMTALTGVIQDPAGGPRAKAHVRLTPIGALAAATLLAPGATTGDDGTFSILVAAGGHYALEATDPTLAFAETDRADASAGDIGAIKLGAAIALSSTVKIAGTGEAVRGAVVSLLCLSCTGVDRTRPLAQAVTSDTGNFRLTVPDPGPATP